MPRDSSVLFNFRGVVTTKSKLPHAVQPKLTKTAMTEWRNQTRADLIEKEYQSSLTTDEQNLLELLQEWNGEETDKKHPFPGTFNFERVQETNLLTAIKHYPKAEHLIAELGIPNRTVYDYLKRLEKKGAIRRVSRGKYQVVGTIEG